MSNISNYEKNPNSILIHILKYNLFVAHLVATSDTATGKKSRPSRGRHSTRSRSRSPSKKRSKRRSSSRSSVMSLSPLSSVHVRILYSYRKAFLTMSHIRGHRFVFQTSFKKDVPSVFKGFQASSKRLSRIFRIPNVFFRPKKVKISKKTPERQSKIQKDPWTAYRPAQPSFFDIGTPRGLSARKNFLGGGGKDP